MNKERSEMNSSPISNAICFVHPKWGPLSLYDDLDILLPDKLADNNLDTIDNEKEANE